MIITNKTRAYLIAFNFELRGNFLGVRLIHVMIAFARRSEGSAANATREFILAIFGNEYAREIRRSVV